MNLEDEELREEEFDAWLLKKYAGYFVIAVLILIVIMVLAKYTMSLDEKRLAEQFCEHNPRLLYSSACESGEECLHECVKAYLSGGGLV